MTRMSIHLLCLTALSLLGADQASHEPEWGASVEGCRMTISTDREQYDFGESINIHVVIQNETRTKLRVVNGQYLPCRLQVIAPNNKESPLTL
jgi:hypothetical protein